VHYLHSPIFVLRMQKWRRREEAYPTRRDSRRRMKSGLCTLCRSWAGRISSGRAAGDGGCDKAIIRVHLSNDQMLMVGRGGEGIFRFWF
jgi:hypothetical protein